MRIDFAPPALNRIPPETVRLTQLTESNFDAERDEDEFHYHGSGELPEAPEYFGFFPRLETLNYVLSVC
jgi:hypothetical protein